MDDINKQPIKPQRVEWIDTLKGIGIFLVFLGHLSLSDKQIKYIFSFHMPLFFFMAGMFFKYADANSGFYRFFLKKVRARMVPYVYFGILTYCIWIPKVILLERYGIQGSQSAPESIIKPLVGMIYGIGTNGWLEHNNLLWFLPCLMITELLFLFVSAIAHNKSLTILLLLLFFAILGYADSKYSPIRLPFGADVAFTAVVFYGCGYILMNKLQYSTFNLFFAVVCFAIGVLTCYSNARVDMNYNYYGNIVLFYISSFCNIYAYMYISTCLANKHVSRYINYVGKNSLIFFLLEAPAFLVLSCSLYIVLRIRVSSMELSFTYGSAYALIAMILVVPVSYLITNYAPFMIGKKAAKVCLVE